MYLGDPRLSHLFTKIPAKNGGAGGGPRAGGQGIPGLLRIIPLSYPFYFFPRGEGGSRHSEPFAHAQGRLREAE